jgi:hypothetical protein
MVKRLPQIFIVMVLAYGLLASIRISVTTAPDFSVYYRAALAMVQGRSPYQAPDLYTGLGYPPFSLLPYVPLTLLPEKIAQVIFLGISLVALFPIAAWSLKLSGQLPNFQIVLLLVAVAQLMFPVRFTLGMGQSNLLALFLLLGGFLYRSQNISAAYWAVMFLVKPHLLFLIPFLIISGQLIKVAFSLIILTAVVGAGLTATGLASSWYYLSKEVPQLAVFAGREIYYNQGVAAFFSRFLDYNSARLAAYFASAVIFGVSLIIAVRNKKLAFFIGLPAFLLIEPLSWQHHYVFLIPVLVYLYFGPETKFQLTAIIALILVSINWESPQLIQKSFFGRIALSHVFFGTLIAWASVIYKALRKKPG